MQFRVFIVAGVLVWPLLTAGCSEKLETGYTPRGLGDSEAQRRAYYASPYSPEATPAGEFTTKSRNRRPSANY